jgi:hypothetical protein
MGPGHEAPGGACAAVEAPTDADRQRSQGEEWEMSRFALPAAASGFYPGRWGQGCGAHAHARGAGRAFAVCWM